MKKCFLTLVVFAFSIFVFSTLSWAQCPEDPNDRGECDTLNVICLDCEQSPGSGPYLVRFPLLVTHDQIDYIDSIGGFVIPLTWTHTNPTKYCSLTSYNNDLCVGTACDGLPPWVLSIFRHVIEDGDTVMHNRMMDLSWKPYPYGPNKEDWDTKILELNEDPTYMHMALATSGSDDHWWWEGDRVLLATLTFRIEDTMHVCLDTTFWPPSGHLKFGRFDAETYVPRDNLPHCFWIGPPQIRVTSPNGGEVWIVDETHDITWASENFYGENVKIEFSADDGNTWMTIIDDTPNDGVYSWLVPDTTSDMCKVKVSDAEDGEPYDESDSTFSIIYTSYFTIDAIPDTQWVKQGDTTDYEVILTSSYGFSSPCTLTMNGLPPLATYEFDPLVVIPTDTSTLTIEIDSLTPLGSYVLTIIGTEMTKQVTDSVQVLLYILSSINRKPEISVPGPQTVYAGLQLCFSVLATDPDTLDTLTLTKTGVGDFPCYPRVSPAVCYFQWTTVDDDTLNSPYQVIFAVDDGRDSTDTGVVEITVLPYNVPPSGMEGDVTGDTLVDLTDVLFLINYLFMGGPPPNPPSAGDVNGDCFIGLSDLLWLINYLYRFGPPPQIRCLPGDFNYDGYVNLLDPAYFIDYMAFSGPFPISMRSTDVNADCFINLVDLVYEIKYLLRGGETPQPGCVEPRVGMERPLPPGIAEVGFSQLRYDHVSRVNQMPIYASFDDPVAGVELIVTFDPDEVSLLPPTLTSRTENMGLFYDLKRGELVIGLVDINGVNFIQPGDGPILNLRFVSNNPKSLDLSSIQIEKATFVDMQAREMLERVIK